MRICHPQLLSKTEKPLLIGLPGCSPGSVFDEDRAFFDFGLQTGDACAKLFAELNLPGGKVILPSLNRILVRSILGQLAGSLPAIIFEFEHRCLKPLLLALSPPLQNGSKHIVAILENIRRDPEVLSCYALDWIPAAFETRFDVLDHCGRHPVFIQCAHGLLLLRRWPLRKLGEELCKKSKFFCRGSNRV